MRPQLLVCAVAANAVFFASGIAVGQRTSASKLDKYLRSPARTEMDWIALEADVDLIRGSLPYRSGISIPETVFNYKENRLEASVFISSDFEKAPLEAAKAQIGGLYRLEYVNLKAAIPELSEDDFVLSVKRDSNFQLFAECRHGNIVFH